jgi:hypothetical protein
LVTGKIALAHLNEFPDYYIRLEKMESPRIFEERLVEGPRNKIQN